MRPSGLRVVLIIGVISMFGDFVYEGGRAVLPDFMRQLGMSAFLIGALLGLAELAGWAARPLGGLIADKTGKFSVLVKIGYVGLIVIPLMAFAGSWYVLAPLIFAERMLKGLRTPARDAMLARLRSDVGLGMAFGIHEFLDQFGATLGPLLAMSVMALSGETRYVFITLLAPYALLLIILTRIPRYTESPQTLSRTRPSRQAALFSLAVGLNAAGLLPIPIILYLVSQAAGTGSWLVPAAYTVAMVVDAAAALALGRAFDKAGPIVLAATMALSATPCLLVGGQVGLLMLAAGIVGVVISAQESVYRAMVAQLAESGGLGGSYALYGLALGGGSAAAGLAYGLMVDLGLGIPLLLAYSAAMQTLAITALLKAMRKERL